jgi:PAS domain S-box-containing protein
MEAGVPFALLSASQLLAFAAAAGLALVSLTAGARTSRISVVAGAVLLAAAHVVAGANLGYAESRSLALARGAAYLLIALGLVPEAPPSFQVVAPLGATVGVTGFAAGAAFVAAVVATLRRSGRARWLLGGGLLVWAVGEAFGAAARSSDAAALTLLSARAAGSLLVLGYVARVATRSLLGKVVGSILSGTLLLAIGAAGSVGTVLSQQLTRDQNDRLAGTATGQVDTLQGEVVGRLKVAAVVTGCSSAQLVACATALLGSEDAPEVFILVADRGPGGTAHERLERGPALQAPSRRSALLASDALRSVLSTRGTNSVATLVTLFADRGPVVAAVGIAPIQPSAAAPPQGVFVYGYVVGQARLATIKQSSTYDATLLVQDRLVASTLEGRAGRDELAAVRREYAAGNVAVQLAQDPRLTGITVSAEGSRPTIRYVPLTDSSGQQIAVLALSAPSSVIVATQRSLLRALFIAIAAIALLVALVAIVLGRRLVDPVRRLTVAAARVREGDLSASAGVESTDEVGVLARQFDAMTLSLSAMTEDLRDAAAQESALRARLETVVDSVGEALVVTDSAGVVTSANPAAVELLGRELADLVGERATDVLPDVDLSPGAARAGAVRRDDGRPVAVVSVTEPLRSGDGNVVVLRDMTREREVERMKTEFLSNVSHELRTPLTPIRGYAEILRRHPNVGPQKTAEYADVILEANLRMARVVDLLVDVAAVEAGRVQPEPQDVDVRAFLDERLGVWRVRAAKRDFRRRLAPGLPSVHVDPVWAAKAFDELIDNAVKYSDRAITLGAAPVDGGVRVWVKDQGPGIPEDAHSELFTPFEQLDGSATRTVGGLGLGLSFVRRVADEFGMAVSVESVAGKGSTFGLDLPAAATPRAGRRKGTAKAAARARR